MIRLILPVSVLGLWLSMALFGPWLNLSPNQIHVEAILQGPSSQGWLGFDDLGRSLFDRLVAGARISCQVSLIVVAISFLIGTILGTVSAYLGRTVDHVMVRIMDVFLSFPGILLAIAIAGILGPGIENLVLALSLVGWVGFARLSRAQVLSIRHREHVLAARALGRHTLPILAHHILPLILTPLIVEATFAVAGIIIGEAGLSFLGLGVQPPQASWGSMIRDGTRYMLVAPHMVIVPGFALFVVVLSINQMGDWLRDHIDVRR
ncbi:MAG: ABC transporter permease [Gammaproteobacteria bacterium]|nr:MAG: ABC transporter permease [Gammaproteobacteria bacterium]